MTVTVTLTSHADGIPRILFCLPTVWPRAVTRHSDPERAFPAAAAARPAGAGDAARPGCGRAVGLAQPGLAARLSVGS